MTALSELAFRQVLGCCEDRCREACTALPSAAAWALSNSRNGLDMGRKFPVQHGAG